MNYDKIQELLHKNKELKEWNEVYEKGWVRTTESWNAVIKENLALKAEKDDLAGSLSIFKKITARLMKRLDNIEKKVGSKELNRLEEDEPVSLDIAAIEDFRYDLN